MTVCVTVLDEGERIIVNFDASDYPSADSLSMHLESHHLSKVQIGSDGHATYTGMMEAGEVKALARLLKDKKQDKAWFNAFAAMKCGSFTAEKDYVDVLLYAKTKAPSPPQPPSRGLLPVSPRLHRYGGQVMRGIGASVGSSAGKAPMPASKTVTPPARTGHEDSLKDSVDEGQEEERSEVSDEEEDDEPGAKRAAAGAGAGSLGKRPARITLRGHAHGLVAASPRKHGQTRVEEDEEKDDDGIFAKKRGRRASDNAPKSKGISKGQGQGQKKSLKKGQVQGKEDAQEEGEEEGQEKEEEEGKEKGKGKGKKKEGKEDSSHNSFGGDEDGKKGYPIGDEPHGMLCKKSMKEEISKWPAAEFVALGAVVLALEVEFEGKLPPCVTYTNVDKVMQHALRNKRRTVSEWVKKNPNKLCSSQIAKETEAYKKYVVLRWTKGIKFVPAEWGLEYKRGRDFWQASKAADQLSAEAAAPSLTVPPVMVEQLQSMLSSLAPVFMDAYGVQEATVLSSIEGVLATELHKFQVSELVICL
ncbi:hypothetical protein V8C86DRAFT_2440992 [Haematococcus lacustris]